MSLTNCLKKLNIAEHEAAILRGAAKDNAELGHPAAEAARLAVQSLIDDTQAEMDDLSTYSSSAVAGARLVCRSGRRRRERDRRSEGRRSTRSRACPASSTGAGRSGSRR